MKKLFLLSILLGACGKPLPQFENINLDSWKADKNGCLRQRAKMLNPLQSQKNKLKGLSEDEMVSLLGRPDQNELYKRNQKFFHYAITPAKNCGTDSASVTLSIRFNAMGLAKEVEIE